MFGLDMSHCTTMYQFYFFFQEDNSSTVLAAVALQDHWVKNLNLGGLGRTGPRNVGLGPAARSKQKKPIRSVVDTGRSITI